MHKYVVWHWLMIVIIINKEEIIKNELMRWESVNLLAKLELAAV